MNDLNVIYIVLAGVSASALTLVFDFAVRMLILRHRHKYHRSIAELTEQKYSLADANLLLLEKKEELEEKTALLENQKMLLETSQGLLEQQKRKVAEINKKLAALNDELSVEKDKSERLLLNILPAHVAEQLKQTGRTEPEHFDSVTVLFSDIVDFTASAARISPAELIEELNAVFTGFDDIISANGCERIKTIGDAYLAISGAASGQEDHSANILRAAMDMMDFLEKRNRESIHCWHIRCGIERGCIVGGVVGTRKYIYDIFGDTVNTAARLEQHSPPMRIHVSQKIYEAVRGRFIFSPRGELDLKGKGMCSTYFLEGSES